MTDGGPHDARVVARELAMLDDAARGAGEWPSVRRVRALLYLAHAATLARLGRPLVSEPFVATPTGPLPTSLLAFDRDPGAPVPRTPRGGAADEGPPIDALTRATLGDVVAAARRTPDDDLLASTTGEGTPWRETMDAMGVRARVPDPATRAWALERDRAASADAAGEVDDDAAYLDELAERLLGMAEAGHDDFERVHRIARRLREAGGIARAG